MTRFFQLRGHTTYADAHALQKELLHARIKRRIPNVVLVLEHAQVITLGRARDAEQHVLLPDDVPVLPVERGGDVTWHGPGQLVVYPIIGLEGAWADLHRYLHALEQSVIDLLAQRGLEAHRDARNTGVWLPHPPSSPRKVCSVGIACRKWVTWHGLALNVRPSLDAFRRIRPCGFDAQIMTRLADHLVPCPSLDRWAELLIPHLARVLELSPGARLERVDGPEAVLEALASDVAGP